MQVIRLTFDLMCVSEPYAFKRQLELIEQLQATDYRITPQARLEYAILLFQNGRAVEGGEIFRSLRQLWREGEQFVRVPERLRWLRTEGGTTLQTVQAVVGSDYGTRAMARVQEFNNAPVPLRPEEFGFRDLRPGMRLACCVSFGFNGPVLATADGRQGEGGLTLGGRGTRFRCSLRDGRGIDDQEPDGFGRRDYRRRTVSAGSPPRIRGDRNSPFGAGSRSRCCWGRPSRRHPKPVSATLGSEGLGAQLPLCEWWSALSVYWAV